MNAGDLVVGATLAAASAAYLVHGWLRASATIDAAFDQPSRDRHPSARPLTPVATVWPSALADAAGDGMPARPLADPQRPGGAS